MNDTLSIVTLVLVGICIASAIFHAFAAFTHPFNRTHFYFFASVAGITVYELFHLFTFKSPTIDSYISNLRVEISMIILFSACLAWFAREYCQIKAKRFELVFSALMGLSFIANLAQTNTLQYNTIDSLRYLETGAGSKLSFAEGDLSLLFCITAILILINFLRIFSNLYKHYKFAHSKTSLIMMLSMMILIVTGFQGIMVRAEVLSGVHLGPFGIMGMVITMSVALIRELILALRESEIRYRSLVEQSPFSFHLLNPSGSTLRVNHAWEKLWGSSGDTLRSNNILEDKLVTENGLLPFINEGFNGHAAEIPATKFALANANKQSEAGQTEKWIRSYIYPIKDEHDEIKEIVLQHEDISDKKRLEDAFRVAASVFTVDFDSSLFTKLARSISKLMDVEYVLIGSIMPVSNRRIKSLAFCHKGVSLEQVEFDISDSPLQDIYSKGQIVAQYKEVTALAHPFFCIYQIQSIMARTLVDAESNPLGILLLFDSRRFKHIDSLHAVVDIFSARASAEIERNSVYELMQKHQIHLQRLVDRRTQELTMANKELEAFSYSVSHDLRAPLRSISGFANILSEDFNNVIPQEASNYLTRIQQNARYMSNLIDDLLQLSRVSRFSINRTKVNLSELFLNSVKKQQELEPRVNAEIVIEPEVYVNGDKSLLSIAIENLVSNAWKYTSKTKHTVIECGQKEVDGSSVYYIKDNGAGFDMKYSHKLFTAFNRLHSNDDFQGTGVGLATVSRIISRHSGSIWAEAVPNKGASFYFTLQNKLANLSVDLDTHSKQAKANL